MKMKICRICLVMDVKMYNLGDTAEKTFIENIFKQNGYSQNLMAQHYICYECRAFLGKTIKFIQRALNAQKVLHEILREKNKVIQSTLRGLDRHTLGLNSNFTKQICYNININGEECNEIWSKLSDSASMSVIVNMLSSETAKSKPMSKTVQDDIHIPTYSQSLTVIPSTIKKQNKMNTVNEKKHCSTDTFIPKAPNESGAANFDTASIEVTNKVDEKEYYIEIKTEPCPDPLASTSVNSNAICLVPKIFNRITNEPQSNIPISSESYNCTLKTLDTYTEIKIEEIDEDLIKNENKVYGNNMFDNISYPLSNVESVYHQQTSYNLKNELLSDDLILKGLTEHKAKKETHCKKITKPRKNTCPVRKKTNVRKESNKKQKLKIKSASDLGSKVVEENISKTAKEPVYVFSDNSNNSIESKKYINMEDDDDYRPTKPASESEESMYDRHDDKGRQLKKPVVRKYPRKCDHCNFEIPIGKEHYIHYLRFHKDIVYPYARNTPCVCQFCGKVTSNKTHQKYHEMTHGAKTIKCPECPKVFHNVPQMKNHLLRIHFPSRKYECDYCGKIFKIRADLIMHIRIHTGEKPYVCHICGAGFAHGGNMGLHIRTKHQLSVEYKIEKTPKRKYPYTCTDDTESQEKIKTKRGPVKAKGKNIKKDLKNALP